MNSNAVKTLTKTKKIVTSNTIKMNKADDGAILARNMLWGNLLSVKDVKGSSSGSGVFILNSFMKELEKKLEKFLKKLKQKGCTIHDINKIKADLVAGIIEIGAKMMGGASFNEAAGDWLKGYIPKHIHDETFLEVYDFFASVNHISDDKINAHHKANSAVFPKLKSQYMVNGFIEYEHKMTDLVYGVQNNILDKALLGNDTLTAANNTCGVIATYNAMAALNNNSSPVGFVDLLSEFEKNGIALDGYIGTSPNSIQEYLDKKGYETEMLVGGSLSQKSANSLATDYEAFIMTSYNSKDNVLDMIHTICITKEKGKYVIHNAGDSTKYDSLGAAVYGYNSGKSEPICVIGVTKDVLSSKPFQRK